MPQAVVSPKWVILLGIFAVSTASIFIRFAQEGAPSLVIAAFRLSIAALAVSPIVLFRKLDEIRVLGLRSIGLLLAAGVFLAVHFATWITSLEFTSVTNSVVLVTTTPLWVALLSPVLLKESVSRQAGVGLLLAVFGGIIVALGDACTWSWGGLSCPPAAEYFQGNAMRGNFMALVGAWMAAGYFMIGRQVRGRLSLPGYIFMVYGCAALVLVLLVWILGLRLTGYSQETYFWMLLLGLVPQLIGHSAFNWALRYLSAAFVSITLLGEPIGSIILALILLKEAPTLLNLVGAILILFGIYLAAQPNRRIRQG